MDAALAAADFVSLHVPLAPETESLGDAAFLNALKPSCCFINTARGPIVDEGALLAALKSQATEATCAGHFELSNIDDESYWNHRSFADLIN